MYVISIAYVKVYLFEIMKKYEPVKILHEARVSGILADRNESQINNPEKLIDFPLILDKLKHFTVNSENHNRVLSKVN